MDENLTFVVQMLQALGLQQAFQYFVMAILFIVLVFGAYRLLVGLVTK